MQWAKWTYGVNINVPLLNLTKRKGKSIVCYGAAHAGIMYDYKNSIMEHFQGHVSIANDRKFPRYTDFLGFRVRTALRFFDVSFTLVFAHLRYMSIGR